MAKPLTASKSSPLTGTAIIPGDKSISHRSVMFGAIAQGTTKVSGLLEGEDVLATADAMRAISAKIEKDEQGVWHIEGIDGKTAQTPETPLDMGNSGTSTRLLMGLFSGYPISAIMHGDASLTKRPMGRVMRPLSDMGAEFIAREDSKLPLALKGSDALTPITYELPVASAQVKSAILLAGLNAKGKTTVIEPKATRDHTENMLRHFGVEVETQELENGAKAISIEGGQALKAVDITVPADPSSAGFPAVAAALTPGSDITLPGIGMNPTRNGLYLCLKEMGANIEFLNERVEGGEKLCDIRIQGGAPLHAITVPEARVPSMIDEFPVLAMAAACASGSMVMSGLEELRVKESDRLAMVAQGLKACGVSLEMGEASLRIHSNGQPPLGGANNIATALDHRIAMAFLVLGSASEEPITIDDGTPIATSFPNFVALMNGLGAKIS